MGSNEVKSSVGERTLPDTLQLAASVLYVAAGLSFIAGLYADWQMTGQVIIPWFAIADEPAANSGLFILSMVILILGYLISKAADWERARRTEEVDETQEWTVDVGNQ